MSTTSEWNKLECNELGVVTHVATGHDRLTYYFRTERYLETPDLKRLQSYAACEGVASVERSSFANASFVVTLKPETLQVPGAADAASYGLVQRFVRFYTRREQQALDQSGRAIYGETTRADALWGS